MPNITTNSLRLMAALNRYILTGIAFIQCTQSLRKTGIRGFSRLLGVVAAWALSLVPASFRQVHRRLCQGGLPPLVMREAFGPLSRDLAAANKLSRAYDPYIHGRNWRGFHVPAMKRGADNWGPMGINGLRRVGRPRAKVTM